MSLQEYLETASARDAIYRERQKEEESVEDAYYDKISNLVDKHPIYKRV